MAVYTDLLASAKTFSSEDQLGVELGGLASKADPDNPAAADAVNAVHTIEQDGTDHTGGTFALTVLLANGETFTTGTIAYNANAATIETAIDSAATTASITGWTNGDITVAGGILQAAGAAVTLTFDGTSVAGGNHVLTAFDGALLTGGVEPTTRMTLTTPGQTIRQAWAVMIAMGIVSGTLPDQNAIASTDGVTLGPNAKTVPVRMVRDLAREAAAEDNNNASYQSIMLALGQQDRAPAAELTGNQNNLG